MTITHPHDRPLPHEPYVEPAPAEPFVPVYARTRRSRKGGVRTWMILAPVGALVLGGVAAAMIAGGGDDGPMTPLVEPAATGPVLTTQPLPIAPAPVETAAPTPAPVVRTAPAPARRAAPVAARRPAPAPAAATREAPAEPAGPRPYTSTLNTSPTTAPAAPAPTPAPTPVIVIQPQP